MTSFFVDNRINFFFFFTSVFIHRKVFFFLFFFFCTICTEMSFVIDFDVLNGVRRNYEAKDYRIVI